MGKRKRESGPQQAISNGLGTHVAQSGSTNAQLQAQEKRRKIQEPHDLKSNHALKFEPIVIQIVVGTYEKALHGFTASIPSISHSVQDEKSSGVEFADTFLFNAHDSAIRCLATSPSTADADRITLATGGSDQVINLYSISTTSFPTANMEVPIKPKLVGTKIVGNPLNREIGSLQHHAGAINALYFPTRSKLLSAAEDNTIAVARTRDWTVLSTIKAPVPKVHGRPSGDTAPSGGGSAGVNDFAIHPSMKLMLSVGKGEKCMRLWNLITGKKAAVLNFDRKLLQNVGEGKHSSGEGRRVRWSATGDEFMVAFERGCVVYGTDSRPKCRIQPYPGTKIHQIRYIPFSSDNTEAPNILALSTEDGRILFFSTPKSAARASKQSDADSHIPRCGAIAQLGGRPEGITSRIKDFVLLSRPDLQVQIIVTGSSDGGIRLWSFDIKQLATLSVNSTTKNDHTPDTIEGSAEAPPPVQVGKLLGTYEVGHRITCLAAFIMSERTLVGEY